MTSIGEATSRRITPVSGLALLLCLSCSPKEPAYVEVESLGASEDRASDVEDAGLQPTPDPGIVTANSTADAGSNSSEGQSNVPRECETAGASCGADAGFVATTCEDSAECEPSCPGCSIDGECLAAGLLNAENHCQICDPSRSENNWSANDGGTCDDGLFCTELDSCLGGICSGDERTCEDGVTCNGISLCDEESRSCSSAVSECGAGSVCDVATDSCVTTCSGCLIDAVCVSANSELPGNPCLTCQPQLSATSYSAAIGKSCGAGPNACSQQDSCDAQGRCSANDLPANTACGDSTESDCDQPDSCDGSGACLARTTSNGSQCDDGAFCTVGDQCQGGQCVGSGNRDCGNNQVCSEQTNSCDCQGCVVGNTCFAFGALNPVNPCQVCDPGQTSSAFSPNTGAACGLGGSCQLNGSCLVPPAVCGDGVAAGTEVCDEGGTSRELGACNPECTGFYERKTIRRTVDFYGSDLGGPTGADAHCVQEFGGGWKALLVGGDRRATVSPFLGDGQLDWVLQKFTYYFSEANQLVWRTDTVALLGASAGSQQPLLAPLFDPLSAPGARYPWSGYRPDWTTLPSSDTCSGWTSVDGAQRGGFITDDLSIFAFERCSAEPYPFLLCVEQ